MTIDRQESLVQEIYSQKFASNDDAVFVGLYKDEGYNLEAEDSSRNFWKMLTLVKAKQINTIIVSGDDRIFRGESGELRGKITDTFRRSRVKLVTSSNTILFDPGDTSSRIASSVTQELGAVAKLESMKTLQDGRRRKLSEKGDWFLNVPPYGLRCERVLEGRIKKYRYTIVEEEAKYIRDVFRLYIGEKPENLPYPGTGRRIGAGRIAKLLEEANVKRDNYIESIPEGVATATWDRQKVLRIIKNETYTGRLIVNFNPTDKISGFDKTRTIKTLDIPAIIDDRLFYAAQHIQQKIRDKLLDDRQPRTETNWLHGIVTCQHCDQKITGRLADRGHRYYGCDGGHGLYRADDLEGIMEGILKRVILDPKTFKALLKLANDKGRSVAETKTLEKLIDHREKDRLEIQAKLDALLDKNLSGLITDEQYQRFREKMEVSDKALDLEIKRRKSELTSLAELRINVESLEAIRDYLLIALEKPEKKSKILRLATVTFFNELKIVEDAIDTSKLPEEEIGVLYQQGRLVLKDLKEILGWSPKKIYSRFGQTKRKSAINFTIDYQVLKSNIRRLSVV